MSDFRAEWLASLTFPDGPVHPKNANRRLRLFVPIADREWFDPFLSQGKRASVLDKGGRSLFLEIASCFSAAGRLHHREPA